MATTLSEPVSRWTIQARLNATDPQWRELQSHLTAFVGPGGLIVYDWPSVVVALRRVTRKPKRQERAA